jgi:hypothetical protein
MLKRRREMMKTLLSTGLLSVAMLATPAMAQEATQEPGVMGYNYPNTEYLRGGYGHRLSPRPSDYYYGYANRQPSLAVAPPAVVVTPYGYIDSGYRNSYGYYSPY